MRESSPPDFATLNPGYVWSRHWNISLNRRLIRPVSFSM